MRMSARGQVTIPVAIRNKLGLQPGDDVEFAVEGDAVLIKRFAPIPRSGRRIVDNLRRRGDIPMSTDEIVALTRGD